MNPLLTKSTHKHRSLFRQNLPCPIKVLAAPLYNIFKVKNKDIKTA